MARAIVFYAIDSYAAREFQRGKDLGYAAVWRVLGYVEQLGDNVTKEDVVKWIKGELENVSK